VATTETSPRNTFPSDGKVMVVGFDASIVLRSKYVKRVYFWGTEELVQGQEYPPKVEVMILSDDLVPGDERRIREVATARNIRQVMRAHGLVRLEELLGFLLRHVDINIDPAGSGVPPKPDIYLVTEQKGRDEEVMPPADVGEVQTSLGFFWIPISRIVVFKGQPRESFDQVSLALLAASISEGGQEEPVWVRRIAGGPNYDYELVDGERRYHACMMVHVTHMKAVFKRPKTKIQQYKLAVIGNFGHEPHPPLEIARSIHKLATELPELKDLSMAKRVDALTHIYVKSPNWILYHLSLLKLVPEVQAMMEPNLPKEQRLPVGMGAYLATIEDKTLQIEIAKMVVSRGISVNQAREYARRRASETGATIGAGRKRQPRDDYIRFERFTKRVASEGDIQIELPEQEFKAMFQTRTAADIKTVSARLDRSIKTLTKLKEKVDVLGVKE
jgi:ParB/RepB/Spo0J family partition protein